MFHALIRPSLTALSLVSLLALAAPGCDSDDSDSDNIAAEPTAEAAFAELLTFSVDSSSSTDQTLALLDEIGTEMAKKAGFVHRYLGHNSSTDTWLIINFWEQQASATTANTELSELESSQTLNGLIDLASLTFYNIDLDIAPRRYADIVNAGLIETVFYDPKDGVDVDTHLGKVQAVTDMMYATEGYFARMFGRNADTPTPAGQTAIVAVNFWSDEATVTSANPVISTSEAGVEQINDIDFTLEQGGLSPTLLNYDLMSIK